LNRPRTYQNPDYGNIFAAGIAFAPPHLISKPMKSKNGTPINPTPPRTGMPAGIIGKAVAKSICDRIKNPNAKLHEASMAEMGAACVASAGKGILSGTAAAMTVYPVVPDFDKYPGTGRDTKYTIWRDWTLQDTGLNIFLHLLLGYLLRAESLYSRVGTNLFPGLGI